MGRRCFAAALACALSCTSASPALGAAPDPLFAALLSTGSTAIPVGISGGLLLFGRGKAEGIRFDLGITALAVGASFGPSVGQIYGDGGTDAVVAFVLRTLTTGVMVTGAAISMRGDEGAAGAGDALFVLGAIPTTLLAVWDIFGAASSARAARYRAGHSGSAALELEPSVLSLLRCPGPIPCL